MDLVSKICCTNFVNLSGKKCYLGIDEAGRGPVLGPMVYGGFLCVVDAHDADVLKPYGVNDSKQLTEGKRDQIFEKFSECKKEQLNCPFAHVLHVISPGYISTSMLARAKFSLNDVSHEAAIEIIRKCVDSGIILKKVFLDTVGPPEQYQFKLENLFPSLDILVSKKADSLFPVVSAASICAKVTRDRELKEWKFTEKNIQIPENGYGSGYPGDPLTKEYLDQNCDPVFGYPSLVRFGWSTVANILDKKGAAVRWEDADCETEKSANPNRKRVHQKSILNFFGTKGAPQPVTRHFFFEERRLNSVVSFSK